MKTSSHTPHLICQPKRASNSRRFSDSHKYSTRVFALNTKQTIDSVVLQPNDDNQLQRGTEVITLLMHTIHQLTIMQSMRLSMSQKFLMVKQMTALTKSASSQSCSRSHSASAKSLSYLRYQVEILSSDRLLRPCRKERSPHSRSQYRMKEMTLTAVYESTPRSI